MSFGRADTDLPCDEVIAPGTIVFLCVGLEDALLSCYCRWISAKRIYIHVFVTMPGVVRGESSVVCVDIRVTACSVDLVMDGFTGAALSTSTSNVLYTDIWVLRTNTASSHS